jgi:hypothetical protein
MAIGDDPADTHDRRTLVLSPRRLPSGRQIDGVSSDAAIDVEAHPKVYLPAELSESIATIIAQQFAQFQRQMFDQFQQAMMVMFQTFSVLHRDQMDVVRQELDRVQELTKELHALQAELAKQSATKKEAEPTVADVQEATAAPLTDPVHSFDPENWNEAFLKAAQKVMAATADKPETAPMAACQPSPVMDAPSFDDANANVEEPLVTVLFAEENKEEVEPALKEAPVPEFSSPSPAYEEHVDRTPAQAAADIHALLCQKIAALQAERQSRWQRIISFLAGKPAGKAVP